MKKRIFAHGARITSAKSFRPGSSSQVLGVLWCNLSLILEHFYSKTHKFFINNVCKFQNFHSPVKKKKKNLQEKTYMRILHQKTDKIRLKRTTWQLWYNDVHNYGSIFNNKQPWIQKVLAYLQSRYIYDWISPLNKLSALWFILTQQSMEGGGVTVMVKSLV